MSGVLEPGPRTYRYLDFIVVGFVTVLLVSNLLATKRFLPLGSYEPMAGFRFELTTGFILFPISYIFGDVLVEVYGYAVSRRVIWLGFGASLFMAAALAAAVALPPAPGWDRPGQTAFAAVLGQTPRIVLASLIAFWIGEFINSYVLAKMKLWTQGKHLWTRTIGSTVAGQLVDSIVFQVLAFAFIWEWDAIWRVVVSNYLAKVVYEAAVTPFTYWLVAFLKRAEGVDHYDRGTDFTPFSLRT